MIMIARMILLMLREGVIITIAIKGTIVIVIVVVKVVVEAEAIVMVIV